MPRPPNAPIVALRAPPRVLRAIDAEAARTEQNRSAMIRELVLDALRARGLWPPS